MSIGKSGRIVLEVDPKLKRELYGKVTSEGITLKEWFITSAEQYLSVAKPGKNYLHGKKD